MPLIVDGILVTLEYFPENWGKTRIGKLTDEQILELRRYRHKKYYQAEV